MTVCDLQMIVYDSHLVIYDCSLTSHEPVYCQIVLRFSDDPP